MLWVPEVKANLKLKVKLCLEWEEIYEKRRGKNLCLYPAVVWEASLQFRDHCNPFGVDGWLEVRLLLHIYIHKRSGHSKEHTEKEIFCYIGVASKTSKLFFSLPQVFCLISATLLNSLDSHYSKMEKIVMAIKRRHMFAEPSEMHKWRIEENTSL